MKETAPFKVGSARRGDTGLVQNITVDEKVIQDEQ